MRRNFGRPLTLYRLLLFRLIDGLFWALVSILSCILFAGIVFLDFGKVTVFLGRLVEPTFVSFIYWLFFAILFGLPMIAPRVLSRRYSEGWADVADGKLMIGTIRRTNVQDFGSAEVGTLSVFPNFAVRLSGGIFGRKFLFLPVGRSENDQFIGAFRQHLPKVKIIIKSRKHVAAMSMGFILVGVLLLLAKFEFFAVIKPLLPGAALPSVLDPLDNRYYDLLVIFPCLAIVAIRSALEMAGYSFGDWLLRKVEPRSLE